MRGRSTTDVLILFVAGTVCLAILVTTLTISVIAVVHPEQDTTRAAAVVANILNTLIGLLAGYLAGRTYRRQERDDA